MMPCVEGGLLVYKLAVPTAIDPSDLHPIFVSSAGVSAASATVVLFVTESHNYYLRVTMFRLLPARTIARWCVEGISVLAFNDDAVYCCCLPGAVRCARALQPPHPEGTGRSERCFFVFVLKLEGELWEDFGDGGEWRGVLWQLLPSGNMCVRAGIVHAILAAAALWLCLSGGSAGEVDADAASLFQAIFVLNPAEHGGVFGERRAKMLERLEFLSHTIPVHIVGLHHSEHAVLLSELNLSATHASGRERRVAWGRLANLAGTDAPCAFGPTALRLGVKSSNNPLRPN